MADRQKHRLALRGVGEPSTLKGQLEQFIDVYYCAHSLVFLLSVCRSLLLLLPLFLAISFVGQPRRNNVEYAKPFWKPKLHRENEEVEESSRADFIQMDLGGALSLLADINNLHMERLQI